MSIEYIPLVNVGGNQVLYFGVFVGDSLPQVIQHQFLKSFGIDIVRSKHFGFVARFFGFNNYPYGTACGCTIVNHQVIPPLGINKMISGIIRILQKIRNQILMELFRLKFIDGIKDTNQIFFKGFNFGAVGFYLQKGFIQGNAGFQ